MKGKSLEEWQKLQRQNQKEIESSLLPEENFFGRKAELTQLQSFIDDTKQKLFCIYGVPMIGKSTLVRQFCHSMVNTRILNIKFNNPENPAITLAKHAEEFGILGTTPQIIVIQNFEEALLWKGDQEHLHEIKVLEIKRFLEEACTYINTKVILESRFQIKLDFLPRGIVNELSDRQLGKIDRIELYEALNEIYRHKSVEFNAFDEVCEKMNDHVWLIELAMQDNWLFEDVREAVLHPESVTQKLWNKIQVVLRRLSVQERTLLCAFSIANPTSEDELGKNIGSLSVFSKKEAIRDNLMSLRKKLMLVYEAKTGIYELNPFLREVCFFYLSRQNEMKVLEKLDFYRNSQLPKYNSILQAHEKGDYNTFFRLIKEKRKVGEHSFVLDILREARLTDPKPIVILNEIGVTYKWQKKYTEAIETLEKALDINPKHIQSLNELAIVYKEQKDYDKAIKYFEKGCELGNIHSYNALAILYKEQKDYPKAIETLEKALAIDSKHIQSLNELAIVYKEQKDYPKAIETLEKALNFNYKDVKSINELAIVYKETGHYLRAREVINEGLRIEPSNNFFKATLAKINLAEQTSKQKSVAQSLLLNNSVRLPVIVILTAIKEEFNAVRAHLVKHKDADRNDTFYEEGIFEQNGNSIAQIYIRECGAKNTTASQESERAIHYFKPDYMFFVGIAGSRKPNDFSIGDVIIPEKIYSYEGGKSERESFRARPDSVQLSYSLFEIAKRERGRNKWKKLIKGNWNKQVKADLGTIASGEQLVEHYNSDIGRILTDHFNDTQAVEMEGFGFGKATIRQGRETNHLLTAVVRGISDIIGQDEGGNHSATTEARPANSKAFASDTAAAFAFWMIYKACVKEK